MPQSCCVVNCTHYRRKNSQCRLFRFPADESRAGLWERNVRRAHWERMPWHRICECHFEEQEFEQHRRDGRKKLLPTAVPSMFPTHYVKLPARPNRDNLPPLAAHEAMDDKPPAWQLLPADPNCENTQRLAVCDVEDDKPSAWQLQEDDYSIPSCESEVEIPIKYLLEQEEDAPSEHVSSDDAGSYGEAVFVSESNDISEAPTQLEQDDNVSLNLGPSMPGESSTMLQRYQREISLLRQTLHNYKQRAWHMDIVLTALRKENELLRGVVQDLNPGQLSDLLDLQSS